jgi:hypothetical protein
MQWLVNSFRLRRWTLAVLAVLAICISWIYLLWDNLPHSDTRVGIAIEEAQSLVIFPICMPTYIPTWVESNPLLIYDADDANVPEVSYIRLSYKSKNDSRKVLEVYQRYTRSKELSDKRSESALESAKISLLYWMVPYPEFLPDSVDTITGRMQIKASSFETDELTWGFYEIVEPNEYRATMTKWIDNNVEYQIFSHLQAEEIKKVTLSMFKCSGP